MKPNSFLIKLGVSSDGPSNYNAEFSDSFCKLWLDTSNSNHIQYAENTNGFCLFVGERSEATIKSGGPVIGQGCKITYFQSDRKISIESDELGTAIIYYTDQPIDGVTLLSNRLDNIIVGSKPNWNAIQRYLNSGYTILDETFFTNVKQSLPAQRLTASIASNYTFSSITDRDRPHQVAESPESLIRNISDQLSHALNIRPRSILMMSAGWDSRTLLINGSSNYHGAYTHGDLSSREIKIAHQLTAGIRLNHSFVDTQHQSIDSTLLDTMLNELGFCIFPIWYLAAQQINTSYGIPISSGVLGELLGGHYGSLSMGNRYQKMVSALSFLHQGLLSDDRIQQVVDSFVTPASGHWFLNKESTAFFKDLSADTKEIAFQTIFDTYNETGSWQTAIENFNMSHRARQYILKQAQAASSSCGYITPFADNTLVEMARMLPFKSRVHNKANRKILLNKRPGLLKPSMAATLVSARRPIEFQELSRAIRVSTEILASKLGAPPPHLGWFNYEHMYQTSVFHEMTESLKSDIWNKEQMHNTLSTNKSNGIDAGSTLDMLCKVKTVDYYLSLTS